MLMIGTNFVVGLNLVKVLKWQKLSGKSFKMNHNKKTNEDNVDSDSSVDSVDSVDWGAVDDMAARVASRLMSTPKTKPKTPRSLLKGKSQGGNG